MQALRSGRLEAAAHCFRSYLARHPDDATNHNNLGVTLQRLGDAARALECYETAARLAPGNADARYNVGVIHHLQGHIGRAEHAYRRALRAEPTHPEANREYGMLRLCQGDFSKDVWSRFRQRRRCEGFVPTVSRCTAPLWNGEPLEGETILTHGEQGLGDEILYASCYPDLMARAGHCVIETHPRLENLFQRSFPGASVLGRQRESDLDALYPAVAYQVPGGDLPLHFRSSLAAFPDRLAYLKADPGAVARWKEILRALGTGLKVGISWRGGTARTNQAHRSFALAQWNAMLRLPGACFVNLQYDECDEELALARRDTGCSIYHWPEAIADYDETAALVCALDLVITVTTSVAHLSGALGQKVWILANAAPRWCYLAGGSTMPWYSSARIFRQARLGDWNEVMEQVAAALARERA